MVSGTASGSCEVCDAGRYTKDAAACELCSAGKFGRAGTNACESCPSFEVSPPGSSKCISCEGRFFRKSPDVTKQFCEVNGLHLILMVVAALASTIFSFLCLTGFLGRTAVADVSFQGDKVVMTTTLSHLLLKHSCPEVTLLGTGNPNLEKHPWKVQALNSFQLTLHGKSEGSLLDTSMGQMAMSTRAFIHTGLWRCPLILWCLLFAAAAASSMTQFTGFEILVMAGLGVVAGALAFCWRRRQGGHEVLVRTEPLFS